MKASLKGSCGTTGTDLWYFAAYRWGPLIGTQGPIRALYRTDDGPPVNA